MTGRQGPFWEELAEINPDAVIFDGPGDRYLFDSCIVGIACRFGMDPVLVYDEQKMVGTLAAAGGISEEEAVEYLWSNIFGAWLGDGTPMVMWMNNVLPKPSAGGSSALLVDILTEDVCGNGHS